MGNRRPDRGTDDVVAFDWESCFEASIACMFLLFKVKPIPGIPGALEIGVFKFIASFIAVSVILSSLPCVYTTLTICSTISNLMRILLTIFPSLMPPSMFSG